MPCLRHLSCNTGVGEGGAGVAGWGPGLERGCVGHREAALDKGDTARMPPAAAIRWARLVYTQSGGSRRAAGAARERLPNAGCLLMQMRPHPNPAH